MRGWKQTGQSRNALFDSPQISAPIMRGWKQSENSDLIALTSGNADLGPDNEGMETTQAALWFQLMMGDADLGPDNEGMETSSSFSICSVSSSSQISAPIMRGWKRGSHPRLRREAGHGADLGPDNEGMETCRRPRSPE